MKIQQKWLVKVLVLVMICGLGVSSAPGYCEWFSGKKEVKQPQKKQHEVTKEVNKLEEAKIAPVSTDVAAAPAAENAAPELPKQLAQPNVIEMKFGEIRAQQQNVQRLEKMLEREKTQLATMQSEFATNYKVDLKNLKAGKVDWDAKAGKLKEV